LGARNVEDIRRRCFLEARSCAGPWGDDRGREFLPQKNPDCARSGCEDLTATKTPLKRTSMNEDTLEAEPPKVSLDRPCGWPCSWGNFSDCVF